jgi:hypothetical protein
MMPGDDNMDEMIKLLVSDDVWLEPFTEESGEVELPNGLDEVEQCSPDIVGKLPYKYIDQFFYEVFDVQSNAVKGRAHVGVLDKEICLAMGNSAMTEMLEGVEDSSTLSVRVISVKLEAPPHSLIMNWAHDYRVKLVVDGITKSFEDSLTKEDDDSCLDIIESIRSSSFNYFWEGVTATSKDEVIDLYCLTTQALQLQQLDSHETNYLFREATQATSYRNMTNIPADFDELFTTLISRQILEKTRNDKDNDNDNESGSANENGGDNDCSEKHSPGVVNTSDSTSNIGDIGDAADNSDKSGCLQICEN